MDSKQRIAKCEANDDNIFYQLTEIKSDMKDIYILTFSNDKIMCINF